MVDNLTISVKADLKDITRYLTRIQRKQLPFATALALTTTAKDVQRAETVQLTKKLDRPTPFTKRSMGIKAATKRRLTAEVFIKRIQAAYLNMQVFGGTRRAQGQGTGVPYTKNKKLNKFGNIAGRRRGLVKGKKQFIDTIKGIPGVWQTVGGKRASKVKLLIAFEKVVRYRPRLPFFKTAEGVVRNRFVKNFNAALARALRTAR